MNSSIKAQANETIDYKKKYKTLKKKLRFLVYEQECFLEELKKSQKKLLKITNDKSFLLDQLMQYEHPNASSDSDYTESIESMENIKTSYTHEPQGFSIKKNTFQDIVTHSNQITALKEIPKQINNQSKKINEDITLLGSSIARTVVKSNNVQNMTSLSQVHMSREEIEKYLDIKRSNKSQFLSLDAAPHSLPEDIFCQDNISSPDF